MQFGNGRILKISNQHFLFFFAILQ